MRSHEKPAGLASAQEVEKISRAMLAWANAFPDRPAPVRFEYLPAGGTAAPETGMALSTVQGTAITRRYLLGGYQAEYQFQIVYRVKPGGSNDRRLSAGELLSRFGDWAEKNRPSLGPGIRALRVEPVTYPSKFAAYEDGYEDYQIFMKLTYEVNV